MYVMTLGVQTGVHVLLQYYHILAYRYAILLCYSTIGKVNNRESCTEGTRYS